MCHLWPWINSHTLQSFSWFPLTLVFLAYWITLKHSPAGFCCSLLLGCREQKEKVRYLTCLPSCSPLHPISLRKKRKCWTSCFTHSVTLSDTHLENHTTLRKPSSPQPQVNNHSSLLFANIVCRHDSSLPHSGSHTCKTSHCPALTTVIPVFNEVLLIRKKQSIESAFGSSFVFLLSVWHSDDF